MDQIRQLGLAAYQKIFLFWTWLKLYYLGAIYFHKEIDRKLFKILSAIRLLDFDKDLPLSLAGKRAVVTGGTRGIGLVTVKELLARGCHCTVASSSAKTSHESLAKKIREDLKNELRAAGKDFSAIGKLEIWPLDLSSMTSVCSFASKINGNVNYLILNAGIMFVPYKKTSDGFESQMAVNYLGPVLLLWKLLPLLNATGKSNPGEKSRIVLVSSSTHFVGNLRFEDLHGERIYSPYHFYAQSKLAEVMFSYKLHRYLTRYSKSSSGDSAEDLSGVTVNVLHPGIILTDLYEHVWWVKAFPWIPRYTFRSVREGAETTLFTALSAELEGVGGKYLEDCCIRSSSSASYDRAVQEKLWHVTLKTLTPWLSFGSSGKSSMPDPNLFTD